MARVFFLVLLLANLLVFVWAAGYLGTADEGREPERLKQQLLADRLKATVSGTTPQQGDAPALACRRVGPLGESEAEALAKAIAANGGSAESTAIEESTYWVYIPAASGKAPDKDIAALKKAGIKDYSLIKDKGPNLNAVSFGYYSREEVAKGQIEKLAKAGIKSAKILARSSPTGRVMLNARGTIDVLDTAFAGLGAQPVACAEE
ncbi:MAG: SPOR domain-containing protein [Gammaproteobacteria bacterium]|nr:SPOR domain-containing protein [Gammaproteobacteria bacterium]MBU1416364.1 SPOR domain-containing protein [Gammaproteobacteria bacterium]